MPLGNTSIALSVSATQTKALDLGEASFPVSLTKLIQLLSGVGAGQADMIFTDTRTLAASANESLDLAGSALQDAFGANMTFARIKAVIVTADAANTNDVQVTRPASNGVPLFMAAGDGIALKPGAVFLWAAQDATGVVVTAGTGDLLNIANSAGTTGVNYTVVLIGASA